MATIAAIAATAGCDGPPPPRAAPPSEPPQPSPGQAPAPALEASPWPAQITDLAATVDDFATIAECTERLRNRLPAEIADLVTDLGYDALLEDACGSVAAVRDGAVDACDALSISAVRNGCRVRLAVFQRRPEACPTQPGAVGRDPSCLAWASRDPELCRGASGPDEVICRAVFGGQRATCDGVRADVQSRCRTRVGRFGAVVGDDRRAVMAEVTPSFRVTLRAEEGAMDDQIVEGPAAARGVVLENEGCTRRLEVGALSVLAPREPEASITLSIPAGAALPLRLPLGGTAGRLLVAVPGRGLGDSLPGGTGAITLETFTPAVGGRVVLTVDGALNLPPGRVEAEGRVETFVRDVTPLPAGCAPDAPAAGAAPSVD